jgi:hypothetical protein
MLNVVSAIRRSLRRSKKSKNEADTAQAKAEEKRGKETEYPYLTDPCSIARHGQCVTCLNECKPFLLRTC